MRSQDRSTCYFCSIISNFVLLSRLIATQWSIPLMRTSLHNNGRGAHLSSVPTWEQLGRGQVGRGEISTSFMSLSRSHCLLTNQGSKQSRMILHATDSFVLVCLRQVVIM